MAPEQFRRICSKFPKGVTVVTALRQCPSPHPIGMTVSSFTGVSLEPPTVLICLRRESYLTPFFLNATHFGVNVLSEGQRELSQRFASRGLLDRFDGLAWQLGPQNVPLLPHTVAHFICETGDTICQGDHIVVFGRVFEGACSEDRYPLVHWTSNYQSLNPISERAEA